MLLKFDSNGCNLYCKKCKIKRGEKQGKRRDPTSGKIPDPSKNNFFLVMLTILNLLLWNKLQTLALKMSRIRNTGTEKECKSEKVGENIFRTVKS